MLPFQKEEIDILSKAEVGESKQLRDYEKKLLLTLSEIIKGEVLYENDTFYVVKNTGEKIEFKFEASGYTKLGLLWKLIRNGLLRKDRILLWDEPENSINPEIVPILVDVLLELSKNGVQIFIATHDYNIARYFDIRKDRNIPVMFFYMKNNDGEISCKSSDEYLKITDNFLENSSEELFKAVVDNAMRGLNE